MRRKNGARTCNPPDSENDGVDLNRNFGYKYAYDNIGSSSRGCSEEYRGTSAFSEPETQAIRSLVAKHHPKTVLHWHGWGNDVAFPFSYDWRAPMSNADLGLYQEFATEMAASNHYASGRAWESVGYTTNGEADDWGWGDAKAVSVTVEVGSSSDGFWPPPSRIRSIAEESAWPARYMAWASGPMLQIDTTTIVPDESMTSGELRVVMQNNGLGSYTSPHRVCANAVPPLTSIQPSEGWQMDSGVDKAGTRACLTLSALKSRAYATLPRLRLTWTSEVRWVALTLTEHATNLPTDQAQTAAAAAAASFDPDEGEVVSKPSSRTAPSPPTLKDVAFFQLRIQNVAATLRGCDELCQCASADNTRVTYSHECRSAIAPGAHCKVAKTARTGANWASGVLDEHFVFSATQYSRGGRCTVSSVKRDTLVAVYASCERFGAQAPLGFANSENGRTATVAFPCEAGKSYDLFWNAEYMPGRFSFTVSEACAGNDCVRAHRFRHLLEWRRLRHKQRRSK